VVNTPTSSSTSTSLGVPGTTSSSPAATGPGLQDITKQPKEQKQRQTAVKAFFKSLLTGGPPGGTNQARADAQRALATMSPGGPSNRPGAPGQELRDKSNAPGGAPTQPGGPNTPGGPAGDVQN